MTIILFMITTNKNHWTCLYSLLCSLLLPRPRCCQHYRHHHHHNHFHLSLLHWRSLLIPVFLLYHLLCQDLVVHQEHHPDHRTGMMLNQILHQSRIHPKKKTRPGSMQFDNYYIVPYSRSFCLRLKGKTSIVGRTQFQENGRQHELSCTSPHILLLHKHPKR